MKLLTKKSVTKQYGLVLVLLAASGSLSAAEIAKGVHILGAGRTAPGDKIAYTVGDSEIKKVGTQVKQGEPLMMIHYKDEAKLEAALEHSKNAYRLAPKRPTPPPLVVERVA